MIKKKTLEERFIETGEKLRLTVEEKIDLYQKKLDKERDNDTDIINIITALGKAETDLETKHLVIKMLTKGVSDMGLKMLGDALKSAHEVVKLAKEDQEKIRKAEEIQKEREELYEKS